MGLDLLFSILIFEPLFIVGILIWLFLLAKRVKVLEALLKTTPVEKGISKVINIPSPSVTIPSPPPIPPPKPINLHESGIVQAISLDISSSPKEPSPFWVWLTGGNLFVRAGVILTFLGIVFLLRFSFEHGLFPLEFRLIGSALVSLVLLVYGWRLRQREGSYGLILQGGGIGILYLTIFAAFNLYQLMPALLAFSLLVIIVTLTGLLAVQQNSLALAIFAIVDGFITPL
jgi:uncharacterized membrane protein